MREAYPEGYVAFLRLYRHHRYQESIDALEDLWMESRNSFYKALMQVAAAQVQLQRANLYGAARMLTSAGHHLQPYSPTHMELDVATLLTDLEAVRQRVATLQERYGDQAPVPVVLGHIALRLGGALEARV